MENNEVKTASLNRVLESRVRNFYRYRININSSTLTDKDFEKRIDWCKTNCKGSWNFYNIFISYFQFEEESDAIMFSLVYGNA